MFSFVKPVRSGPASKTLYSGGAASNPLLRISIGLEVFDPALDALDALLTVAFALRVEVFRRV